MHPLFAHLKRKAETKFHGVISIPFQNGEIGSVKVFNVLAADYSFEVCALAKVFERIEEWKNLKFFGTMEVPFQRGVVGKPKEGQVLKVEEL
jgi:hypothetical protein